MSLIFLSLVNAEETTDEEIATKTDLKLNIVRRILGRHGGQVDMVNTEPHGVLCTLTFPTESMDSQSEIMEENYHEP